jgi:hypothetical protein
MHQPHHVCVVTDRCQDAMAVEVEVRTILLGLPGISLRWTCPSPRSVESDRRTPRVEEHFDRGRPNWHELGDLRTDLVAKLAAELLQRLDIVDRSSQRSLSMVIGSERIRLPVA